MGDLVCTKLARTVARLCGNTNSAGESQKQETSRQKRTEESDDGWVAQSHQQTSQVPPPPLSPTISWFSFPSSIVTRITPLFCVLYIQGGRLPSSSFSRLCNDPAYCILISASQMRLLLPPPPPSLAYCIGSPISVPEISLVMKDESTTQQGPEIESRLLNRSYLPVTAGDLGLRHLDGCHRRCGERCGERCGGRCWGRGR